MTTRPGRQTQAAELARHEPDATRIASDVRGPTAAEDGDRPRAVAPAGAPGGRVAARPEPGLAAESVWAVGGGVALLALCLVVTYAFASLLMRAGPAAAMPGYHTMMGIFLAGTLATFVGRAVTVRTG